MAYRKSLLDGEHSARPGRHRVVALSLFTTQSISADLEKIQRQMGERKAIYEQVQQILIDDMPYIYLMTQGLVNAWQPYVKGYDVRPDWRFASNSAITCSRGIPSVGGVSLVAARDSCRSSCTCISRRK